MPQVAAKEVTGAQIVGASPINQPESLAAVLPVSYATYRAIRKDPTIAMVRALVMSPIVAGSWSIETDEGTPEDRAQLINDDLLPMREPLLKSAMSGSVDFGWAPYEKVFALDETTKLLRLSKLKPLLQDITTIVVLAATGQFYGFKQDTGGGDVDVPLSNALLLNLDTEGTQWYGISRLENVRATYNEWVKANNAAALYDQKIAGAKVMIRYPPGKSMYQGTLTANSEIAETFAKALDSSNTAIRVPAVVASTLKQLTKEQQDLIGWKIEMLSDSSPKQYSFMPRLEQLDKLKARGLYIPERSVLEGKFGTKADAGVHADLAITQMELDHRQLTRLINWHVVDHLLALNWGPDARGTVRLVAAPLADEKIAFLRDVFKGILAKDVGFLAALDKMDLEALRDAVGVPEGVTDLSDTLVVTEEMDEDEVEELKVAG